MDFGLGSLIYRVGADIKDFNTGMKKVSQELGKVDREGSRAMSGLNRIGSRLTDVGTRLSVGFSLPLLAAGVAVTKFSTDMNAGMANVATLIPGSTARVLELKKAVQDMAVDVGQRTGTLTQGLYQVISAFGDSADTVKILDINARAAAAGLSTVEDAVALTSAVTKGYGDTSATALQKVSDLAFKTVEMGQTTFPELAASMGKVVASAETLGVSQEELFAGFAALTGVTGNTSEVSTQLSSILRAMMKPTEDMSDAIAGLGFSSAEAMVSTLGMKGSLDALMTKTDGTSESVAKLFGRAEALNAVFTITGTGADKFNLSLAAMEGAAGATDTAFKEQTEGINANGFALKQVAAQAEVAAQKFGDALAPMLGQALKAAMPLIETLGSMVEWFTKLPTPIQNTIFGVTALAIAVGPLLLVTGQVAKTFVSVHEAANLLSRGLPFLAKGFGGVTATMSGSGGLVSLLGAAGPLAIALGVAIAGWALYKAITKMQELNAELERLEDFQRRGIKATDEQAAEIKALEAILDKHRKTVDSTGLSIEEYIDALRNAAKETGEFSEVSGGITVKLDGVTLGSKKAKEAVEGFGGGTEKAGKQAKEATEKFRGLQETLSDIEQQKAAEKFVDSWMDLRRSAGASIDAVVTGVEDMQISVDSATSQIYDLNEVMRATAQADITEASASGLLLFRDELEEVPKWIMDALGEENFRVAPGVTEWIRDSLEETNKEILKSGKKYFDQQEKQVKAWKNQVSTILSDLGKNIAGALWSIFDDTGEGAKLQEQEDALRESLAERGQSWADYQQEIAEKRDEAHAEYVATLEKGEQALADSLAERGAKYDEETADLEDALEDRVRSYEDYQEEVANKLFKLRENTTEALAEELEDYQELLDEKAERMADYVEDSEKKLDQLRKRNKDDIEDEIQDTERKLADKQLALKREREDTEDKIKKLLRAGKSADSEEIRDLELKLARKEEDYEIFAERQKADLQEYVDEHNEKLKEEETDIKESMARRQLDYDQDVADATERHEKVTADLKTKLTEEETALNASLVTKGTALETFKTETLAKQQALTDAWTAYQESAVADFETIKTEAKTKLTTQETELATSLATQKTAWTTFVTDVNTELAKIEEDKEGNSIFGRVATAFGTMLEGMGQSIIRFGAEYLVGKLFKWLVTDLLEGILPKLATALGSIFGVGGDIASGAAGAGGAAGSAAGAAGTGAGALGGIAGGALGWASLGASIFGGVATLVTGAKQETTLNAIEENTRYSKAYLGGHDNQGGILAEVTKIWGGFGYVYELLEDAINAQTNPTWGAIAKLGTIAGHAENIESNTLGALRKLEDFAPNISRLEGILDGITEVRAELRRVIEVNVTGFGSNREVGLELARALKAQGALA